MTIAQWQTNLINGDAGFRRIFEHTHRVAVLGIKPEEHRHQPAFYVPQYLQAAGFQVIPVPVYYPDVTHILGQPVYRRIQDIPDPVDLVNIFRRPGDIPPHLDDILAANPKAVWMQSGIRNEPVAEALARAGIMVVQDRCIMVEHRHIFSGL